MVTVNGKADRYDGLWEKVYDIIHGVLLFEECLTIAGIRGLHQAANIASCDAQQAAKRQRQHRHRRSRGYTCTESLVAGGDDENDLHMGVIAPLLQRVDYDADHVERQGVQRGGPV